MKKRLILLGLVCILSGCGTISFPGLNAPKQPEQVYNYRQSITTEPRVVQTNEKGQSVVFTAQTQTVDVGYERKDKPLSAWQKFCNWIANFGIIGILLLILGLIFAPAATIGWIWNKKNTIETALKQTVIGIDKSGIVGKDPAVGQALASSQDAKTKSIIDDIQQPGK